MDRNCKYNSATFCFTNANFFVLTKVNNQKFMAMITIINFELDKYNALLEFEFLKY